VAGRRAKLTTVQESAEVVIIGGGAVGASTAYHLTELGITDVILVERDALAAGSTSKSAGGVRLQFADELNIRIALRSLAELESFAERFDVDIALVQAGYLFLLDSPEDVERFREALALQASLGVPSRELTPAEAAEIVPPLATEDLLAATFCPRDGYATPEAVVQGYVGAAAARGVRVRQGTAVEGIEATGGRITGVVTSGGRIATGIVVCAAGVWSKEVAALAGLELPVEGEARWMHYTPRGEAFPALVPLTIDFTTGFYFHREGQGIVFGGREASLEELAAPATKRLPIIEELPVQSSWWGWYENSPDRNAIAGEATEPSRFFYATGFSGHGFQQSPAVGEHLAELIAGRVPTLDLSPFSHERFRRGELKRERFVV
jgi:glycine/D-amino acid oxidase-like deaminating enzyme